MNIKPAVEDTSCLISKTNEFCTWGGGLDASSFCPYTHSPSFPYPQLIKHRNLQWIHKHLRCLPLKAFNKVQPLLLIDYHHLITPVECVRVGPPGGPAAVKTRLSWTLQRPTKYIKQQQTPQQCLRISTLSPVTEHLQNVKGLWQLVLPSDLL